MCLPIGELAQDQLEAIAIFNITDTYVCMFVRIMLTTSAKQNNIDNENHFKILIEA